MNTGTGEQNLLWLTWLHRGALVGLAGCGVYVALQKEAGSQAPPPVEYTTLALGFAVGTIVLRRISTSKKLGIRVRAAFAAAGLILALGIGIVALLLVATAGEKENALLFVLGGAILCLRPPSIPVPGLRGSP